jgi:hypothetical protein
MIGLSAIDHWRKFGLDTGNANARMVHAEITVRVRDAAERVKRLLTLLNQRFHR